jgi:arylsulfatase A-like enzyme
MPQGLGTMTGMKPSLHSETRNPKSEIRNKSEGRNLKAAVAVALVLGSWFLVPGSFTADAATRPNIIFVLADDLGYGDLGCYGQKLIQTPHLDRMAREGMRFTQFYAGATVCAPSRSVLMTGQHHGHTRVRGNAGRTNPIAQSLRPGDATVAKVLKEAGYATALCGKWGLGDEGVAEAGLPTRQGFDYFFGYLNQHHAHNFYPEFLIRNESRFLLRNVLFRKGESYEELGAGWAEKAVDYSHDLIVAEALKWIETNHERPFFLYLASTIPHANNEGTRGTGNGQEVPDWGIYKDKDWTPPNKGQAAMITRLDSEMGRLFDLLRRLKIDDRTLVLFSSDNGHHKEGGNDPEFFDANGPLRGMKRDLYEGGIRVPFIARWPGKIKAGTVSDHVGYFGDLMATACELAGAPLPPDRDSISFVPTLLGQADRQAQHDYLYWEFYERGGKQALRLGNWKAVRLGFNATLPIELYDLSKDIGEEHNLADKEPDVVDRLRQIMSEAHTPSSDWPTPQSQPAAKPGGKAGKKG